MIFRVTVRLLIYFNIDLCPHWRNRWDSYFFAWESQKDKPQTHTQSDRTAREISRETGIHRSSVCRIICKAPFTRYNLLSNRLSTRFDNRVNVCIHDTIGCQTGCQSGCQTCLTTGCIVYTAGCQTGLTTCSFNRVVKPVVKPVWQPVWQPCWTNSLFVHDGCQTVFVKPVWQTRFDNRYSFNTVVKRVPAL